MAITLQIFEDSGAESLGRGTVIQEVDNIGWKDSTFDETYEFSDYPLGRPYLNDDYYVCSYKKYNFFKISGTYPEAVDFKVFFQGTNNGSPGTGVADKVQIFYKWSNVYTTPDNSLLNGTLVDFDNLPTWSMRYLSTTGPNGTLVDTPTLATDTVYYTPFLITQLVVYRSVWNDFGNIDPSISIKATVTENKTGLPGYDPDLILWTP